MRLVTINAHVAGNAVEFTQSRWESSICETDPGIPAVATAHPEVIPKNAVLSG